MNDKDHIMKSGIEVMKVELPVELMTEARKFLEDGWHSNFDALIAEALRRYLDSHSPKLNEALIRADVEWGLHGSD